MFRNWMRSRLGLDQAPEGRVPKPMPSNPMGGAGIEGWNPRPMPTGTMDQMTGAMGGNKGIEGWIPKENPYNPPQQTFAATPDESYSSFGRRPGQAYSPFAW